VRLVLASVLLLVLAPACGAAAQPSAAALRAGLPLEDVVQASGLALGEVIVPREEGAPVRVELRDAQGIAALLDVRVLDGAADARAALDAIAPSLSSRGASPAGVGDAAVADEAGSVVAFVRVNLLVVVRAIRRDAGELDAQELAARLVVACDAAPRGRPTAAPLGALLPALQPGESRTVRVPATLVALHVEADGDGVARRTADGWELTRGSREARFVARGVDALLRVAR
jgi:hypothetical protein